jgi:hypothetical protein
MEVGRCRRTIACSSHAITPHVGFGDRRRPEKETDFASGRQRQICRFLILHQMRSSDPLFTPATTPQTSKVLTLCGSPFVRAEDKLRACALTTYYQSVPTKQHHQVDLLFHHFRLGHSQRLQAAALRRGFSMGSVLGMAAENLRIVATNPDEGPNAGELHGIAHSDLGQRFGHRIRGQQLNPAPAPRSVLTPVARVIPPPRPMVCFKQCVIDGEGRLHSFRSCRKDHLNAAAAVADHIDSWD